MSRVTRYAEGIYGVDANYERPGLVSVYLLRSGGEAAVIESAHNGSLPCLLNALEELGVKREEVRYLCVTHVHLDHAGGAGAYMREFPKATLAVHSRGARHMADPSKLVEGVRAVYGAEETARLYGEVLPVPAERIISPEDGARLEFGAMRLRCIDAPGHAKHHMAFFEETTRSLFAGDAFGISYEWMRGGKKPWLYPTSSPVQFDPSASKNTLRRLADLKPAALLLTHFGAVDGDGADEYCESLISQIDAATALTERENGDKAKIKAGLERLYAEEVCAHGIKELPAPLCETLAIDLELNSQGLACWYAGAGR